MYYALNEADKTTLDKIFSIAAGVANVGTGAVKNKDNHSYSYSSIAKAASALVAVFPVLTSRTVSPETAQAVSKFIEQKACNLLTLGLQNANISTAQSGVEYLRQFHQNLDVGGSGVDTVIKTMQTWIDAYNAGKSISENSVSMGMINNIESDEYLDHIFEADDIEISSQDLKNVMEAMAQLDSIKVYDTQLNPVSINDFVVKEFADGNYHVSIRNYEPVNEANNSGLRKPYSTYVLMGRMTRDQALQAQADEDAQDEYDEKIKKRNREENDRNVENARRIAAENERQTRQNDSDKEHLQDRDHQLKKQEREDKEHGEDRAYELARRKRDKQEHDADRKYQLKNRDREEQSYQDARFARTSSGHNVSILRDQDIKKMNDAVPSLLVVKFYRSETASVATEFIIGVKSKMIPVTTTEVLRRIMNDNKDGKKFLNFMRALTGEMSASEFLLGISRIKDDVKSCRVKGAYGDTWNLLKNRADAAREQIKHGKNNDFSAITTVVISQADADELFREENFDISNPKNALHFMDSYNLMAFAIVDDATETLRIIFDDNNKIFEEYSYTMLERESKDGTYKKLINLMAASN